MPWALFLDYCTTIFSACLTASAASPLLSVLALRTSWLVPQAHYKIPTSGPLHLLFSLLGVSQGLPPSPPSGLCSNVTFSLQPFLTPVQIIPLVCNMPEIFYSTEDHQRDSFYLSFSAPFTCHQHVSTTRASVLSILASRTVPGTPWVLNTCLNTGPTALLDRFCSYCYFTDRQI